MDTTAIILATVVVAVVGCFIGFFLCIADTKLGVEVDPKEAEVLDALPGNNCGACGFPGCSGLANSIAKGEAPVNGCPVGGANVAAVIAEIMGVEAGETNRMVAYVKCGGTCDKAKEKYTYSGVTDCVMAGMVPGGGAKVCQYGCHGFGTCVNVCAFDAIHVIDGVAVVDKEKCTSCQACIKACPKNLIELIPYAATEAVTCSNKEKGKVVMDACSVGCIACGLCEKNCPTGAITVNDNIAHIEQEKCIGCGVCVGKCPKNCIEIMSCPTTTEMAS